jgi:hypothetical protein
MRGVMILLEGELARGIKGEGKRMKVLASSSSWV